MAFTVTPAFQEYYQQGLGDSTDHIEPSYAETITALLAHLFQDLLGQNLIRENLNDCKINGQMFSDVHDDDEHTIAKGFIERRKIFS